MDDQWTIAKGLAKGLANGIMAEEWTMDGGRWMDGYETSHPARERRDVTASCLVSPKVVSTGVGRATVD